MQYIFNIFIKKFGNLKKKPVLCIVNQKGKELLFCFIFDLIFIVR